MINYKITPDYTEPTDYFENDYFDDDIDDMDFLDGELHRVDTMIDELEKDYAERNNRRA